MKRYLCMTCEGNFSKPNTYRGVQFRSGQEIKYTETYCPFCAENDFIDTYFLAAEIKKRIAPLHEEKEYLLNIVCEIKNKLSDVDLSKWEA
jgi:hypothetical protein